MKNFFLFLMLFLMLFLIVVLTGCSRSIELDDTPTNSNVDWKDIQLEDIKTGETYMVSDFEGKTVLIESFAVWCPVCTKQQKQFKELHEINSDVVSIAIDIDPNEEKEQILNHMNKNGFNWTYSIVPTDLTKKLIAEFGGTIIATSLAPVVMVCPDQSTRLLPSGVKSAEDLSSEISKGCSI